MALDQKDLHCRAALCVAADIVGRSLSGCLSGDLVRLPTAESSHWLLMYGWTSHGVSAHG